MALVSFLEGKLIDNKKKKKNKTFIECNLNIVMSFHGGT